MFVVPGQLPRTVAIAPRSNVHAGGYGTGRGCRLDADGDSDMPGPAALLGDLGVASCAHAGGSGAGRGARLDADGHNTKSASGHWEYILSC